MNNRHPLSAEKRDVFGKKLSKYRHEGKIPGNVYGGDAKSQAIWLDEKELMTLFKSSGESILIDLSLKGDKKAIPALIRNISENKIKAGYLHIDIQQINLKEKITVTLPIQIIGEASVVNDGIGMLETPLTEVEIEALPTDLPEEISVDISNLTEIGQQIKAKDLKLPKGVELVTDEEQIVAHVVAPGQPEEQETTTEKEQVASVEATEESDENTSKETSE